MKEPKIENLTPDSERKQKRAFANEIGMKALNLQLKGNAVPWAMVIEFTKKIREKYGIEESNKFLLLQDLIGSGAPPELEPTYPLDTKDKEVEKFIEELTKEIKKLEESEKHPQ
ncbi:MAG TPA: hypothetical protein VGO63_01570 [Candidatus Paceibacterota bacterium]|jgi:hypothetical protein|nr:hypothetical protein [Candidatus Paceibacterota bacterium]